MILFDHGLLVKNDEIVALIEKTMAHSNWHDRYYTRQSFSRKKCMLHSVLYEIIRYVLGVEMDQ